MSWWDRATALTQKTEAPRVTFEDVLAEEKKWLQARDRRRSVPTNGSSPIGLALSGGGIRSATFNLGILQDLARLGLLSRIDYLSTVSGGGYIGAWLSAWIRRTDCATVEKSLEAEVDGAAGHPNRSLRSTEPGPVRFLRQFSNYLTPRRGGFSADTWTMVSIYARNLLLNAITLALALSAVLLAVRCVVLLVGRACRLPWGYAALTGAALVWFAMYWISRNLQQGDLSDKDAKWWSRQLGIVILVVAPLWLAAALWSAVPVIEPNIWALPGELVVKGFRYFGVDAAGVVAGSGSWMWAFIGALAYSLPWMYTAWRIPTAGSFLWRLGATLVAGIVGGHLLYGAKGFFAGLPNDFLSLWPALYFGPVVLLGIFFISAVLQVGLMGSIYESNKREWRGRLGAWILITILAWIGLYGIAIYSPMIIAYLRGVEWIRVGAFVGWAGTSLAGVLQARRGENGASGLPRSVLMAIAPWVFVLGLLILLSNGLHSFLTAGASTPVPPPPSLEQMALQHYVELQSAGQFPWAALLLAAGGAVLMSWCVDINVFSMHTFYRNRLIRAYLGASREGRKVQPFTLLSVDGDDVKLSDLSVGYDGPLPIINTTLNLSAAKNKAWQQRLAGSFFFTPLRCGYFLQGVPTDDGEPAAFSWTQEFAKNISLGTAMAISGAAASPNMGFHSSPPLAFLMTVFNIRLGWWVGNPLYSSHSKLTSPKLDIVNWANELFGRTHERSSYVYLSDGGHFENLGIYELVRRRCRLIIASDAGADPGLEFTDLGNAIEKIRNDLGIDVELDVTPLELNEDGRSQWHAVVGRIRYDQSTDGPGTPPGTLVYIKSTLTGDEPSDVLRYAKQNASFPHQSTGDQWFSESQFESYRALGRHVVRQVIGAVVPPFDYRSVNVIEMAHVIRQRWYPPSPLVAQHFTRHADRVAELFEIQRNDPNLRFLDEELYTELSDIRRARPSHSRGAPTIAPSETERRAGFYFCGQLIQLMENVYVDLNLEERSEREHPENRGWMNIFRRWAWSDMLRDTYAIKASTFGERFRRFCTTELDLVLSRDVSADAIATLGVVERKLEFPWNNESVDDVIASLNLNEQIEADELRDVARSIKEPVKVFRLELTRREDWKFHFGFAIATESSRELIYFRVQNQLRGMGLGRTALKTLLKGMMVRSYMPRAMREGLPEVQRFRMLYNEVALECELEAGRAPPAPSSRRSGSANSAG